MFSTRCQFLARCLLLGNVNNKSVQKTPTPQSSGNAAGISSSATHCAVVNYYESLGISQSSTQNDIKAAYYRLSKLYHPDKNQGSATAAKKFHEISQAYEVLGNYRLRKLYDKGIIHTAGPQYARHAHADMADDYAPHVEDDAETKFYKSRFRKSKVADMHGRTPIYDFDEWSRAHYGKSFERRKKAKEKYDRREQQNVTNVMAAQNELVIFCIFLSVVVIYAVFYDRSSYDTPKQKPQDT